MKNKAYLLVTGCLLLVVLFGFDTKQQHKFTIHFNHKIGLKELKLMDEKYINDFGEGMIIAKFKYYISNIVLTGDGGKTAAIAASPWLIDEADSSSKSIHISSPFTNITSIQFQVGIDSIKNVSGVQTGSLDPLKGMFWTWNTGYIFAKLEGYSDTAKVPGHYFTYDIGGFKKGENAARKITLQLPVSRIANPASINIDADISKWFLSKYEILISRTPICHSPGALAMQIADNYSDMFSIGQFK